MKAILAGTFACLGVAACTTQQEPIKPVIVSKIKPVNTLSKEFSVKIDNGGLITTNGEYVYQEKDNMKTLYKVRSSEYSNNVRRLIAKEVAGNKTLNIEVVDYTFEQGWKTTVKVNDETMEGVAVNEVKTVNYQQIEEEVFSGQKFMEDEPTISTTEAKSVKTTTKTETVKTKPITKKQEVRSNKFNKGSVKETKETTKQPEANKSVVDSAKEKAVEMKDKMVDSMKEKTESIVKTVEEKAVKAVEKVENSMEEIKK